MEARHSSSDDIAIFFPPNMELKRFAEALNLLIASTQASA